MTASASASNPADRRRPVVGPRLRVLLRLVVGLAALLAATGAWLGAVTLGEWASGRALQDYAYQWMFLGHLLLGLLFAVPALAFGVLHLRNARGRPNRNAIRAGLALYAVLVVLVLSGLALVRLDFFALRDPGLRRLAYWLHVLAPVLAAWLFVLHRLAGPPLRWRAAGAWGVAALVLVAAGLLLARLPPAAPPAPLEVAAQRFRPALVDTAHGGLVPARELMRDAYCRECHADVHGQWVHSAHRLSSLNNPAYLFSVRETREVGLARDGDGRIARFCAGCHDPVPLLAGRFDELDFATGQGELARAGITCTVCHAITRIDSPRGNADFTLARPRHYPLAFSDAPALRWLSRQLVKARPDFHKRTFLKPLHRDPAFCGSCHKVHLPRELNHYKWLRGQNHYDSFLLSGVSGGGARSFYYPRQAVAGCSECHMPGVDSSDFGARRLEPGGGLQVHDHRFPGANTALPALLDLPPEVVRLHQDFLGEALRVDLFALRAEGRVDGAVLGPLGPAAPVLEPGREYLLEVVVRTLGMGHLFTQGTADSNQVWLSVQARDGDREVGRSGALDAAGRVDPWAHFINAYVLDRDGRRIDRRNAQDIHTTLYDHQIPPGAADVVHYRLAVPAAARGPLSLEVAVRYRKFDTTYLRHFTGDPDAVNTLPVTVLARDRVTLPVAGGPPAPALAETRSHPPAWERWNDYGIGLLRKPGRGQLRQAEEAFRQVEALGSGQGPVNLARVYLREGRLEEAADALARARQAPDAHPWVVTWLTARVDKQRGHLDAAIAGLRRIAATDFAGARARGFDFATDYVVLNELGQTLLERAGQARGAARRAERESLLAAARARFEAVLALDPENATAHFNLALIHARQGDADAAARYRSAHRRYRPDDNARDHAVLAHRRRNPAADHAAEAVVIHRLAPDAPGARVAATRATGGAP